jgi:hypothetical protein
VQRLKIRYREQGAAGLRHRGRGRVSGRQLAADVRRRAGKLLQTRYRDVNDCHAAEKLREVEGLAISRASVQRLRRALGLPAKHRRRPRQYRARRTPEAQMGALVQLDASPFAWLEDRGPAMSLHGAIDDATGTVLALCFRPQEDLHGYATLLHELGTAYGLPLALYGDRLNVFIRNDRHWTLEEQLRGERDPTHFGAMLRTLGIGFIAAGSPQAKGRIERLWRTLQDRLTVELRLRGIATPAAANAYLPAFRADFNARFAHAAAAPAAAWRPAPRDLAAALSCRYHRVVGGDNTVRVGPRLVQLPRGPHGASWAGGRVELRECVDGRLLVLRNQRRLAVHPSPGAEFALKPREAPSKQRPQRRRAPAIAAPPDRPPGHTVPRPVPPPSTSARPAGGRRRPASTHPWRRSPRFPQRSSRRLTPAAQG